MKRALLAMVLLPMISAAAPPDRAEPYRILQQANLKLDASLATSADALGALLSFDYPGMPSEAFQGHPAIRSNYVRTFGQVDTGTPIRLAFRFKPPSLTSDRHSGVYRIDARAGGRPVTVYGRFSVKQVNEGGVWRFAEDRGMPATAADFERLAPSAPEAK